MKAAYILCLSAVFLGLISTCGVCSDFTPSTKDNFLPENVGAIENSHAIVRSLSQIEPARLISPESPEFGIIKSSLIPAFTKYLKYNVRPEFIPPEPFIKSHLSLAKSAEITDGTNSYKADVAILKYHKGGRDFSVYQTGRSNGDLGLLISLEESERVSGGNMAERAQIVSNILNQLLLPDPKAPFEVIVSISAIKDCLLVSAIQAEPWNHRRSIKGVYSNKGLAVLFEKRPCYIVPPKMEPSRDQVFDFYLESERRLQDLLAHPEKAKELEAQRRGDVR